MRHAPSTRRLLRPDWWYRQLLRCFPFDFQREFGSEMSDVFRQQQVDAKQEGRIAMTSLWADTIRGFMTTAPREHLTMLRQDAAYAIRMMRRTPIFTAAAILALGLGIGANTAIFGLLNAVFLNPLPVREPSRLVSLLTVDQQTPGYSPISTYNYRDIRDQVPAFEGVAAYAFAALTARLPQGGDAQQFAAQVVSGNYFDVVGVQAAIGRTLTVDDDRAKGASPVVVLSGPTWARLFGSDPNVIGSSIRLNGQPFTVIGVTPPHFGGTFALFAPDVFVPLSMYDAINPGTAWLESRRWRWLNVVARLRDGVDLRQAGAATDVVVSQLRTTYPETLRGRRVAVLPLVQAMINPDEHGTYVRAGIILAALVTVVLLIACANLANLLLARAVTRSREVALRLALGAGRGRIIRQLLTESVMLSLAGGAAGLLLAHWTHRALLSTLPPLVMRPAVTLDLDWAVMAFTFVLSLITGVLFGLAPALHVSRADINTTLKDSGRQPAAGRQRFRSVLIVGEVALSLVALIVSGLFLRSLWLAQRIEPGFDSASLAVMNFQMAGGKYKGEQINALYERLVADLQSRPGIAAVTIADRVPLTPGAAQTILIEGQPPPPNALGFTTELAEVLPNYFETMGIRLVQGRTFAPSDRMNTQRVAIINETMARTYWPGVDPVGRRFKTLIADPMEIIGVVRDSKYLTLGEAPRPFFYLSALQTQSVGFGVMSLVVRGAADPAAAIPTVRAVVREIDPDMALTNVRTMDAVLADALWAQRTIAGLVLSFGGLAMLLATIGLYGVMAYNVAQRAHEMGLRVALGASKRDILAMVVGRGMALTAFGAAIGTVVALSATRVIATLLYQVSPSDPVTFLAVPLMLALVAFVACYLPARRAAAVDPLVTLRG
jgi:putative ABC transport system permease protein